MVVAYHGGGCAAHDEDVQGGKLSEDVQGGKLSEDAGLPYFGKRMRQAREAVPAETARAVSK
jgi:hypothetical protein